MRMLLLRRVWAGCIDTAVVLGLGLFIHGALQMRWDGWFVYSPSAAMVERSLADGGRLLSVAVPLSCMGAVPYLTGLAPGLLVVGFLYQTVCIWLAGRTLGDWVVGVRIVGIAGQAPGARHGAVRYLAALLGAGILFAGFLVALVAGGRTFADIASRSTVVIASDHTTVDDS